MVNHMPIHESFLKKGAPSNHASHDPLNIETYGDDWGSSIKKNLWVYVGNVGAYQPSLGLGVT